MTTAIVIFVFCLLNALKEVGQMIQQVSRPHSLRNTQGVINRSDLDNSNTVKSYFCLIQTFVIIFATFLSLQW